MKAKNRYRKGVRLYNGITYLNIEDNYFKTNINNVYEKLLYSKIFYSKSNISIILDKFGYNENNDYITEFKNTLSIAYK